MVLVNKIMLAQDLPTIQQQAMPLFRFRYETTANFGRVISTLLPYIFTLSGILLLIYLLFGGLQLMYSAGDPKKVQSAQGKITNALIGFVIVFLAYWLTQLFGTILNIQAIKDIFK